MLESGPRRAVDCFKPPIAIYPAVENTSIYPIRIAVGNTASYLVEEFKEVECP